ncbi:unnamed protein product [Mortierella alpina]
MAPLLTATATAASSHPDRLTCSPTDAIPRLIHIASTRQGPILISILSVVLSLNTYCLFAVHLPFHFQWLPGEGIQANANYLLHWLWSCYLVWGVAANYYYAIVTPPGSVLDGISTEDEGSTFNDILLEMESFTEFPPLCKRCHLPKPERAHHCSVCMKCILKYDHHCPWIWNCVGHFNVRYFMMLLTYTTLVCIYYVYMGLGPLMLIAEYEDNAFWPYALPRSLVAFSEVLTVGMGLVIGGMTAWHWQLVLTAQTTLEYHSNSQVRQICAKNGEKFTNPYDFGVVGNLLNLFNVGRRGHYPWYTAFLPIRIPPIGNGKRFEKCGQGYVQHSLEKDDLV